jgi:hypothetical protein
MVPYRLSLSLSLPDKSTSFFIDEAFGCSTLHNMLCAKGREEKKKTEQQVMVRTLRPGDP